MVSNASSTKPVGYIALDDVGRVTGRQEESYVLYLLPASRYRLRSSECEKRDKVRFRSSSMRWFDRQLVPTMVKPPASSKASMSKRKSKAKEALLCSDLGNI
jgi:hypothetical protein